MTMHGSANVADHCLDLAVVIPAWNERENIELLLPALKEMIVDLGLTAEIIIADGGSRDGTAEAAQRRGARGVGQKGAGYGGALLARFSAPPAPHIVNIDARLFPPPGFLGEVLRGGNEGRGGVAPPP